MNINIRGDKMVVTDAIKTYVKEKLEKLDKSVRDSIDKFVADAPQFDDITMLCIKYNGPNGKKQAS